jgi:hypothetical protein
LNSIGENADAPESAIFVASSDRTPKSSEGKFANKILDTFDRNSFSVEFLARYLVVYGNSHARGRLLSFARSLIHNLAFQDQITPDEATNQAYRLQRTIEGKKNTARK